MVHATGSTNGLSGARPPHLSFDHLPVDEQLEQLLALRCQVLEESGGVIPAMQLDWLLSGSGIAPEVYTQLYPRRAAEEPFSAEDRRRINQAAATSQLIMVRQAANPGSLDLHQLREQLDLLRDFMHNHRIDMKDIGLSVDELIEWNDLAEPVAPARQRVA